MSSLNAQIPAKFKFKKNSSLVYFFQKGTASDTILKNKSDVFYLIVPDSLKKDITVLLNNAQLVLEKNDSLVSIRYLPGFQYETSYSVKDAFDPSLKKVKLYDFKSLINGTSTLPLQFIKIQILNKKEDKIIIENTFYYKDH